MVPNIRNGGYIPVRKRSEVALMTVTQEAYIKKIDKLAKTLEIESISEDRFRRSPRISMSR
jgi:hypothetical protein